MAKAGWAEYVEDQRVVELGRAPGGGGDRAKETYTDESKQNQSELSPQAG